MNSSQASLGVEPDGAWSYDGAFVRHQGLVSAAEQERLRRSRVAIAGLGGVGGVHLTTLARLGIGNFSIADPDRFDLTNMNRQYGARIDTLGRSKTEVMVEDARSINPDVGLRVFSDEVTPTNVADFLEGVDVFVDGIDAFAIESRRLLYREIRRRGIWGVAAGPVGFSTAWFTFSPTGMSFDDYFDLHDGMDQLDQLIAYFVGIVPRATHWGYVDMSQVDLRGRRGPSVGFACNLCSAVVAAEVLKILLGRGPVRPAPYYFQFDAYRHLLRKGRLRWGNRHPLQRLKRWWLRRKLLAADGASR